ncbi:MAG TPA: glycosyltransferase [Mycobacteriales bacterium]|nr:glycosyltransferase [Mycobacteriales bacterium]
MSSDEVAFYLPGARLDLLRKLDVDAEWPRFATGLHAWVLQTYLRLRERGLPVRLTDTVPDQGVLVTHAHSREQLLAGGPGRGLVVVTVRADKAPQHYADVEVVQNAGSADGRRVLAVPHWPQPGLVPRDPGRGDEVRTAAFKGHLSALHPSLLEPSWAAFLADRGIDWHCDGAAFGGPGTTYTGVSWNDYSGTDLVVAARRDWTDPAARKPASKLVNAWLAGVPALLGPELPYRELRRSPLDYLEVGSLTELQSAVDRLLGSPDLYRAMVENGRGRAHAFTVAAVAEQWQRLLFEQVPRATRTPVRHLPRRAAAGLRRLRARLG